MQGRRVGFSPPLPPPVNEPHEFIGFGDIEGPKPYEFIGLGDIEGPKPYEFIGFGDSGPQTL
jgi:hypothetical protein